MNDEQSPARLCVLLVCFAGAKTAARAKSDLAKGVRSNGGVLLDEVVLRVSAGGKPMVYDPHRTMMGALTSALTWGVFGLLASGGSWTSLVLWALIGALCGGLYAYYAEHLASKHELKRIGQQLGPDTSALVIWAEMTDPERLLSATSPLHPATASVAAIADDLSAKVFSGATTPIERSAPGTDESSPASTRVLRMLLLRYSGEHAAQAALEAVRKADGDAPQVELVFESAKSGKRRVISPAQGAAVMARSDVVSWGLFGLVYGIVVGAVADGGILSSTENGVVIGLLWGIFGLGAGALYGLWAGRAVSVRRLKGIGPLLPPDSSMILAWADGAADQLMMQTLAATATKRLDLRFVPISHGAVLDV